MPFGAKFPLSTFLTFVLWINGNDEKVGEKKNFHEADVRLESLSENYQKLVEPLFELKPQGKFPAVFASYKLNYAGAFT